MSPPFRSLTLAWALSLTAGLSAHAQAPAPAQPAGVVGDPCDAPVNRDEADAVEGLGCATRSNLRAMVADPADLVRGAPATPPRGDAALAAAHRHRLGQVKPLEDATSSGAGQSPASSSAR
ncbi:MAG TPA: CpaD family pilus assembly lipoprotein [Phenylobacterium sp.]|jgi:type IV pilus biogenesis protein CpaD/CtpE|nr:CpaD family pilus assembly lipoprotein [Phenylobacterium sp.]